MVNELPLVTDNMSRDQTIGIICTLASLEGTMYDNYTIQDFYNKALDIIENNNYTIYYNIYKQPIGFSFLDTEGNKLNCLTFSDSNNSYLNEALSPNRYNFYDIMGKTLFLLSKSIYHKNFLIEYIEREIYPACWFRQLHLYKSGVDDVWGFFSWAKLGYELYNDISSDFIGLSWGDWQSGEYIFINDLVSLKMKGTSIISRDIRENLFYEHTTLKAIRRYSDENIRIATYYINKLDIKIPSHLMERCYLYLANGGSINDLSQLLSDIDSFFNRFELSHLLNIKRRNEGNLNACALRIKNLKKELFEKLCDYEKTPNSCDLSIIAVINSGRFFISQAIYNAVEKVRPIYKPLNLPACVQQNTSIDAYTCLCLYEQTLIRFIPSFLDHYKAMRESIVIDIRDNDLKHPHPFTINQGLNAPTYISCSYHDDNLSVINLVHELSHALHYYLTITHSPYLFVETRVLPSEFFSFIIEMLFTMHLKESNHPNYHALSMLLSQHDYIYINEVKKHDDVSMSDEYLNTYSTSRILAKAFIENYTKKPEMMSEVENLCKKGISFNIDRFFEEICSNSL